MVILLLATCNNPSNCILNIKLPLYAITSVLYEHVPTSYYPVSLLLYNIEQVSLHFNRSRSSSHFSGQTSCTAPSHNETRAERKVRAKSMTTNVYTRCFGHYIIPNHHPINTLWHHLWQQQNLPPYEFTPMHVAAIKQHLTIQQQHQYLNVPTCRVMLSVEISKHFMFGS